MSYLWKLFRVICSVYPSLPALSACLLSFLSTYVSFFTYLRTCELFEDTCSVSDHAAPNGRMTGGNKLERN